MQSERIQKLARQLVDELDPNPGREGLVETPRRYAEALQFWTRGYAQDPVEVLKTFADGAENYDEFVFQGAIPFWSLCEHHIAPFFGVVHIGYLPSRSRIVGLSKFARVVDIFARRLQCQERMTRQIAEGFQKALAPVGVGVMIRARHSCIESRGVQKAGSMTYTTALLGQFRHDALLRSEFQSMVDRAEVAERSAK